MNKADKALADVRGWLCDNMSAGDAGKGCGMLSVVSRHITELEEENAKLRELAKAAWGCVNRHVSCDECRMVCCGCTLQSAMHELGIEVEE